MPGIKTGVKDPTVLVSHDARPAFYLYQPGTD